MEADRNALKLQQAGLGAPGKPGKENASPADSVPSGGAGEVPQQDMGFIQKYLARIARLEKEIRRLKEVQHQIALRHFPLALSSFAELFQSTSNDCSKAATSWHMPPFR